MEKFIGILKISETPKEGEGVIATLELQEVEERDCPNDECHASLNPNHTFCTECGHNVEPINCRNCGTKHLEEYEHCPGCGEKLYSEDDIEGMDNETLAKFITDNELGIDPEDDKYKEDEEALVAAVIEAFFSDDIEDGSSDGEELTSDAIRDITDVADLDNINETHELEINPDDYTDNVEGYANAIADAFEYKEILALTRWEDLNEINEMDDLGLDVDKYAENVEEYAKAVADAWKAKQSSAASEETSEEKSEETSEEKSEETEKPEIEAECTNVEEEISTNSDELEELTKEVVLEMDRNALTVLIQERSELSDVNPDIAEYADDDEALAVMIAGILFPDDVKEAEETKTAESTSCGGCDDKG